MERRRKSKRALGIVLGVLIFFVAFFGLAGIAVKRIVKEKGMADILGDSGEYAVEEIKISAETEYREKDSSPLRDFTEFLKDVWENSKFNIIAIIVLVIIYKVKTGWTRDTEEEENEKRAGP